MFYSIDSIKFAYDIWVCKFRMELIVTFKFRLFLNVSINVTHSVIHVQVEQTNSIDDFVYYFGGIVLNTKKYDGRCGENNEFSKIKLFNCIGTMK